MSHRLQVGVVSAAFVVMAIVAVYAGIVDFSRDVGDSGQSAAAGVFLPLSMAAVALALATYKAFTGRLFAAQRWTRIDQALGVDGFRKATDAVAARTAMIHVQLLAPNVLRMDRGGGIDHVTVGRVNGCEVRSFRAQIRGGHHWMDVPAVAVRIQASFAPTLIRPTNRGLRPHTSMKPAVFELEQFNRSIEVHSTDPFFASALIDQRMMEWLLSSLRRTVIEVADGWAVAWSNSLRGSAKSPQDLIDLLIQFNDRIPRPIPSLFPKMNVETVWNHAKKRTGVSGLIEQTLAPSDEFIG
jgi:hypothetical protein